MKDDALSAEKHNMASDRDALLMRLICAIRNTNSNNSLSPKQLGEAIQDWDEVLVQVPTEELTSLRQIGLRRGLKTSVEYLTLYEGIVRERFRIQQMHDVNEQQRERRLEREHWEQQTPSNSVEQRTAALQAARLREGKTAITCECDHPLLGTPLTAVLNLGGTHWVCAGSMGACSYSLPVEDTFKAPSRGVPGPLAREVTDNLAAESDEDVRARQQVERERRLEHVRFVQDPRLQNDAKACQLNLRELAPEESLHFRLFCQWFHKRYESGLDRAEMERLWPQWAQEHRENVARRVQQKQMQEASP